MTRYRRKSKVEPELETSLEDIEVYNIEVKVTDKVDI